MMLSKLLSLGAALAVATSELPPGPVSLASCILPSCATGGCPTPGVETYMLRVEPMTNSYEKNPTWGGAHITMSHQENPYNKEAALKKWTALLSNIPKKAHRLRRNGLRFGPEASDWKAFKPSQSCLCGMLLRKEGGQGKGEPWNTLHDIGNAAAAADFREAKTSDFHITIANHKEGDCTGTNKNIPHMANEFASAGWALVLVHFDGDGNMYRVRQHVIG
jgi:hypothetical protein